jgi:hypothetical protein
MAAATLFGVIARPAQAVPASPAPALPEITTPAGPAPFTLYSNLVILPEYAYSKDPVPFALDSTLPVTTVDPSLTGGKYSPLAAPRHVSLASLAPVLGTRIYGIYGCDLLSKRVWRIDYAQQTIDIEPPTAAMSAEGGTVLPLTIKNGLPLVKVELLQPGKPPVTALLKVDTGSSDAILVSGALLQSAKLIPPTQTEIEEQGVNQNGKITRFITRIAAAKIGPYTLTSPIIIHSVTSSTGPGIGDGSIGGEILRRFTVVFDIPHHRMILTPNDALKQPFPFDGSGIFLLAQGPDLHEFRVYSIRKGSPAAHAGVAVGDVITAMNGKPTTELTLDQARQALTQSGNVCTLTVQRGGQSLTISIPLHTLI